MLYLKVLTLSISSMGVASGTNGLTYSPHGFVNIQDLNLVSDPASDVATVVGVQFAPVGFDGYLHIVIDDLHSG